MSDRGAVVDPLQAGWVALAAGDWTAARECFERGLAEAETAEGLEGLGWAAYCADDEAMTFRAREAAYRLYRQRGDDSSAARVAAWLAADCLEFRGEVAVSNGWVQRAHRLLDGHVVGPDHGWLAIHEASLILDDDPGAALQLATEAAELGRRFGVVELEMVGLALEGRALVSDGDLSEGMRRLDEATATALGGEAQLLVCVAWACCYLISACEQVRDFDRASQWCREVSEFCERHGIALLLGVCRAKYAAVLTWQARWEEAEHEITEAADALAASRPLLVGEALVRLGELRRLQGRLEEAEELFARCEGDTRAVLGRAALALDRGRPGEAAELAERFLRRYAGAGRIERGPGLEVAVRAYAELGDHERAAGALEQLREIVSRAGTRPLRAAVFTAEAAVAAARGEHHTARRWLEDALDLLTASPALSDIARVRLDLARELTTEGRLAEAHAETEAARAVFCQLGAATEMARAQRMLERVDQDRLSDHAGASTGSLGKLSRREIEVLALVAQGLTNHEIAERLVLSEHTVHRHVTNILRKLSLPSRTAAASLAAHHGLV
jgi:DNA-binding NarL/FixJ family response regulator